jgi:hypothetical protein
MQMSPETMRKDRRGRSEGEGAEEREREREESRRGVRRKGEGRKWGREKSTERPTMFKSFPPGGNSVINHIFFLGIKDGKLSAACEEKFFPEAKEKVSER